MTFDVMDLAEVLRSAGRDEIVPRFRNLEAGDIASKASAHDLVTQADLQAERAITAALRARFPGAMVLGEEAFAADPAAMDGLAEAELAFVIDPVDGTFNFAAGNGLFGSILAVVRRGETVAGLIADPLRGDMLVAERGAGARLVKANGTTRAIRVAAPVALDQMVSVLSWSNLPQPARRAVAANLAVVDIAMSYGCSAHEYWMIATGAAHFGAAWRMNPWDHLAGVLIHGEAGGYSARLDGSPYRAGLIDGGLLSAPDRDSWTLIRRDILGPLSG